MHDLCMVFYFKIKQINMINIIGVTQGWRKPKTRTMLPPMSGKLSTPKQTPPKSLSVVPVENSLIPSEPLASTSTCVSTSASASISPPPIVSVIQSTPSDCDVTTSTQSATSPQKTAKNSPSSPQSLKESSNKVKKVPLQLYYINLFFFFFFLLWLIIHILLFIQLVLVLVIFNQQIKNLTN